MLRLLERVFVGIVAVALCAFALYVTSVKKLPLPLGPAPPLLRSVIEDPSGPTMKFFDSEDSLSQSRRLFEPGSLGLSRLESVKKCWMDTQRYQVAHNDCTVSKTHKLLYLMLPKSGSSTGNHIMRADLAGEIRDFRHCNHASKEPGMYKFVTVRDPLTRFFASYDESLVRSLVRQDRIPKQYQRFMRDIWGWDYDRYKMLFVEEAGEEGLARLTRNFENFVEDFDGRDVYEIHLFLQVPFLWDKGKGRVRDIDEAFDTHHIKEGFTHIGERVGVHKVDVIHGRKYPRRFNVSGLSRKTIRKICELSSLDFCCLNYEMPEPCRALDVEPGHRVKCEWFRPNQVSEELIRPVLV